MRRFVLPCIECFSNPPPETERTRGRAEESTKGRRESGKGGPDSPFITSFHAPANTHLQALENATKKEYFAANKLVNDKKTTLADMELVFPPALADSALHLAFVAHVTQYAMRVSVAPRNVVRGYSVFAWKRTVRADYDSATREWKSVPQRVEEERAHLMYMSADELARCIQNEDCVKNVVRAVRAACGGQIFLMVEGLGRYLKRKTGVRVSRPPHLCKTMLMKSAVHNGRNRACSRGAADGGAHAPALC
jgi:hypothetical protein